VWSLFCAFSSPSFGCSHPTPHAPLLGAFPQETGKRRPHASNRRLARYDGEEREAMSHDKFMCVNTLTFLSTDLWNLMPQTFALLLMWYKIMWNSFDSSTSRLEKKLRDDAQHI